MTSILQLRSQAFCLFVSHRAGFVINIYIQIWYFLVLFIMEIRKKILLHALDLTSKYSFGFFSLSCAVLPIDLKEMQKVELKI